MISDLFLRSPICIYKYITRGLQSNWGVDLGKDQNRLNMQVNPASPSCCCSSLYQNTPMLWQHFWGGSVAVLDGNLLRRLTLQCTGVRGGGCDPVYEGLGFINIFFLAQLSKFTLWSKAEELVPACLSPFYPHYWSVSIFFLFSVCLHFFLIFCLSPALSSFLVCLHLYLYFLSVSISIWGQIKNED